MLTIAGEKKVERETKEKDYYFSERRYGRFQRSFRLPANSEIDNIKAGFTDGVFVSRQNNLDILKYQDKRVVRALKLSCVAFCCHSLPKPNCIVCILNDMDSKNG